jgi:protoheme ferro-lyase
MAARYPYREQFETSARLVMEKLVRLKPDTTDTLHLESGFSPTYATSHVEPGFSRTYATVYQSRSGRPEDPWLGPDICDYLRDEHARGLEAAVIAPLGFICDHVEVLYDLDIEAAGVCGEIGLPMARAQAVNDHPLFLDALADMVLRVMHKYEHARPLELVATP